MAIVIKNDLIKDAMVETGVAGVMRAVRRYVVTMEGQDFYPDAVLYSALKLPGVPQPGSTFRLDDRCLLSRARATALGDREAQIDLIYERVPLTTQMQDRVTVPIRTMNVPGTRRQIMASYSGQGWPGAALKRACSSVYRCPMRKLVVGKALFGYPGPEGVPNLLPISQLLSAEVESAVSSVNRQYWMGKDAGYWLFDGLTTKAIEPDDDFETALCYYVYATFFTQEVHDWSYWQFLQLPNGQYAQVSTAVVDAIVAAGYDIQGAPSYRGDNHALTDGYGVAVSYNYPAKNFYDIFGIQ